MKMSNKPENFDSMLSGLKRRWQAGLVLQAGLRVLGWAVVVIVVYSILDFFLALAPATRSILNILIMALLGGFFLTWAWRIFRLNDRNMARRADHLLASKRQAILGAFELAGSLRRAPVAALGLSEFLMQRSIGRAGSELAGLNLRQRFPLPEIAKQLKVLLVQVCLAGLVMGSQTTAVATVLERIMFPSRDVPPYSNYTFTVSPPNPKVLYGGYVEVSVEISGKPVTEQVWLRTRYRGRTHKTACFQESANRFAQRLEKVVSPVSLCFSMGRARSRWRQVKLLLQPQIAVATVTVDPPAYTGRPQRRFFVGNEDLAVLAQSKITLAITSNRPLADGRLMLRPLNALDADQIIAGAKTGPNTVTFDWTATAAAALETVIRDLQGTRNRDAFKLQQKIIPDAPPEAVITDPSGFVLATPFITVPIAGYVTDDFGLRWVEMVRTVIGYRDRMRSLGPAFPTPRFEFSKRLNLHTVGVEPGQILEFYLEASDLNPAMTGVSASNIVRIQIISEDEYAEMLRARTTIKGFMERYRLAALHLAQVKKALRELKSMAASGKNQASEIGAKLKKTTQIIGKAAEFFEQMAKDFPAYDAEKGLLNVMEQSALAMKRCDWKLQQLNPPYANLPETVAKLLQDLGKSEGKVKKELAKAEEVALVARVMACASRFRAIVRRQSELVRRLSRFQDKVQAQDLRLLGALSRRQKEIRAELLEFKKDLLERAAPLPDKYRTLRSTAADFALRIAELEIPELMSKGSSAAENQDGKRAHHFATLALEKLEQLLTDCKGDSGFGSLCQGEIAFNVPKDLKSTLEQMLAAIRMRMGRPGSGSGPGIGAGAGGDASDGYSTGSYSPLNVPVFGPDRMDFSTAGRGSGGGGAGRGRARLGPGATEAMRITEPGKIRSESMPLEKVPPKYLEAVKKYFSQEEK